MTVGASLKSRNTKIGLYLSHLRPYLALASCVLDMRPLYTCESYRTSVANNSPHSATTPIMVGNSGEGSCFVPNHMINLCPCSSPPAPRPRRVSSSRPIARAAFIQARSVSPTSSRAVMATFLFAACRFGATRVGTRSSACRAPV